MQVLLALVKFPLGGSLVCVLFHRESYLAVGVFFFFSEAFALPVPSQGIFGTVERVI